MDPQKTYTTFAGVKRLVSGNQKMMLLRTKEHLERGASESVLIFDDQTGEQVDFDFRGTPDEVLRRVEPPSRTGPGRPKLGVVPREVTLLPRHWEWLEQQPSGASAALRRLVDEARKREPGKEQQRRAIDAASRVMWAIAGNFPNFEEASRALFAKDGPRFEALINDWPADVRDHLLTMVSNALGRDRGEHGAAAV